MSSTLAQKAVVGRRVELALHRDRNTYLPGIITRITDDEAALRVRLDGKRYNIAVRPHDAYLRYLDEVVTPVPALPMGRFQPTPADMLGVWEGVPVSTIGEDGEVLILLTGDRDEALAAAVAYDREVGLELDSVDYESMRPCWAVFEWEPEGSEFPWTVRFDAAEGDDQAVHIFYLPA